MGPKVCVGPEGRVVGRVAGPAFRERVALAGQVRDLRKRRTPLNFVGVGLERPGRPPNSELTPILPYG
jgi:hypothetical protein